MYQGSDHPKGWRGGLRGQRFSNVLRDVTRRMNSFPKSLDNSGNHLSVPAAEPSVCAARFTLFGLALLCLVGATVATDEAWANGQRGSSDQYAYHSDQQVSDFGQAKVVVNKSKVIRLNQPYTEALVGNDKIADVLPLSNRAIYVLGKSIGSTSLAILDENKRVLEIFEVEVTHDLAALKRKLRENVQADGIRVSSANGRILLSGTVPDAIALKKAVAIASQYAPEAVTNALNVRSTQQVMLEVRFVEASRTAARELGIGWRVRGSRVNTDSGGLASLVGNALVTTEVLSGAAPFGSLIANLLSNGTSADLIVRALEERGLARRLAEPNLIALSGDTASFLAGGEYPIPVSAENDKITIEFKKFGVALAFTPTVLANGLINLKIEPEVSEIDPNTTIEVNNIQIPGLVVRRANTTVELHDGQGFAIAGLLQNNHIKNQAQLPWIGQVPILGTLFRSAEFRKNETDLVIIVTPRLVRPSVPGERLSTPLDDKLASNDRDFFLHGRAEIDRSRARDRGWRAHVRYTDGRQFGHIIQIEHTGGDYVTSK